MGLDGTIGNASDKLGGKGQEPPVDAASEQGMKGEGHGNQARTDLTQGGENAEDPPVDAANEQRVKGEGHGNQARTDLTQGGENAEDAP
jgi:hypothetical protein